MSRKHMRCGGGRMVLKVPFTYARKADAVPDYKYVLSSRKHAYITLTPLNPTLYSKTGVWFKHILFQHFQLYIKHITHFIGLEWKQSACLVPLRNNNIHSTVCWKTTVWSCIEMTVIIHVMVVQLKESNIHNRNNKRERERESERERVGRFWIKTMCKSRVYKYYT